MIFYREGINLGDGIVDINNIDFCQDIRNCLRDNGHYMGIIDQSGIVYPIKFQAHKQARDELISHKQMPEVIMAFYRNNLSANPASMFYDANKSDTNYTAVNITEKQMMAMYNLCLISGDADIVRSFAQFSSNMGLSYDDKTFVSIIGNNGDANSIRAALDEVRRHNLPIFESVTGISRKDLLQAIDAAERWM